MIFCNNDNKLYYFLKLLKLYITAKLAIYYSQIPRKEVMSTSEEIHELVGTSQNWDKIF